MPVNIPFDKPVSQDLYKGTSEQQVSALTDLLMHFDAFAKQQLSLEAYLRQAPAVPASDAPPAAEAKPAPAGASASSLPAAIAPIPLSGG
jgi:hypothetical protein